MTTKTSWYIFAFSYPGAFVIMFLATIIYSPFKPVEKQAQIKPCNCLTYYEWQLLSTKRDMLLDKRKRSQNDKDSLVVYNRLLGIDETQQVYPNK